MAVTVGAMKNYSFKIIHTNDVHGRIFECAPDGARCTSEMKQTQKCVGGLLRHNTYVRFRVILMATAYRKSAARAYINVLNNVQRHVTPMRNLFVVWNVR